MSTEKNSTHTKWDVETGSKSEFVSRMGFKITAIVEKQELLQVDKVIWFVIWLK